MASEYAIDIRSVTKRYGAAVALDSISLHIEDNEFFTLLGPSGCGKTTMLRIIAGFEEVSAGEIFLYGMEIENLPANERPVNTVFQNYALFPHMTVMENVRFGLEMRGVAGDKAGKRAADMLEMVQLAQFAERKPSQLSGGQQQRVALARALAPEPRVLLLDESLSALDLKLRQAMRFELKQIQRETGITFVFVTHDQDEALTMSDRIAVMSAGHLQQVGSAKEIYEEPANSFVAHFIGETNLLEGQVKSEGGTLRCVLEGGHRVGLPPDCAVAEGSQCRISVRPERVRVLDEGNGGSLGGTIERNIYIGEITELHVRLSDGGPTMVVRQHGYDAHGDIEEGRQVSLGIEEGSVRLLSE